MAVRQILVLGVVALSANFIGCNVTTIPRSTREPESKAVLTPEEAKQALLARMRADRLFGFRSDVWSEVEVGEGHDGWHEFGSNFRINPGAKQYTVWYGPPPEIRGCRFKFAGTFTWRAGVWMADDPVEVESALGGGQ